MAPVIKTVEFIVEVGTDGSFETRSQEEQTFETTNGDVPGEAEQYQRISFDSWGNQ